MLRRARENLFREPGYGMTDAARTTFGCLALVVGCVMISFTGLSYLGYVRSSSGSLQGLIGLSFVLQGIAELLPRSRTASAGWLRVGALLVALTMLAALLVKLLLV